LDLAADFHATTATDALIDVSHDANGGIVIRTIGLARDFRDAFVHTHEQRYVLQFAVTVTQATLTVLIVVGENQFHLQALHATNLFDSGQNLLTFTQRRRASRDDSTFLVTGVGQMDQTHAARAGFMIERHVGAKRRDKNLIGTSHFQNGLAFFKLDGLTVKPSRL
jgi:hypothetical protein